MLCFYTIFRTKLFCGMSWPRGLVRQIWFIFFFCGFSHQSVFLNHDFNHGTCVLEQDPLLLLFFVNPGVNVFLWGQSWLLCLINTMCHNYCKWAINTPFRELRWFHFILFYLKSFSVILFQVSFHALGRNEKYWKNALEFIPDRFLHGNER